MGPTQINNTYFIRNEKNPLFAIKPQACLGFGGGYTGADLCE